jgi:hypothetical protein
MMRAWRVEDDMTFVRTLIAALVTLPLVGLSPSPFDATAAASQAQPRGGGQNPPAEGRGGEREPAEPRREPGRSQGQAQPRDPDPVPPAPPAAPGPRSGDQGRRTGPPPPPRAEPPATYYRTPRRYYFPPVHVQRSFYYHPYFGFYFGPYYGPYYPYPGPAYGPARYTATALRTRVRPVETQVYVNGYYAGVADDFDGVFQRLYLPAGGHEIEFRLEGYQSFRTKIYMQAGDTREITHQMVLAGPGIGDHIPVPRADLPAEWRESAAPTAGSQPASPFGILTVRVEPTDAQIVIDGETWLATADLDALVMHVPAGRHVVEVRKDGYHPFRVEVELSEGAATALNVRLTR